MYFSLKGTKVQSAARLSDDVMAAAVASALRTKSRKVVGFLAESCERAVNEWVLGRRLPNAGALIRLMAADDDVFNAVMDLAGRSTATLSDQQRQALADALRILEGQ
jgi:hypothetical protein